MTSRDLLHIPTPWHNCVVEVEGSPYLLVTKASIPREAAALGAVTGEISAKNAPCFILRSKRGGVSTDEKREEKREPLAVAAVKPASAPAQKPTAPKSRGISDWARRLAAFPVFCWLGVVYHRILETFA